MDVPLQWYINRVDKFRAREHIYRQHGWPTPNYDREQALLALETFDTQILGMEMEMAMLPRFDWQRYHPEPQYEQA